MKSDVVILAGGALDPEWQSASGAESRAMVPVKGVPMYQRVLKAVQGAEGIGDILLIGNAPPGDGYRVLTPGEDLMSNVRLGLEQTRSESVLFVTVDVPFLTSEAVSQFLRESAQSGAAIAYAVVPVEVCQREFPQMKRTAVRLKEGALTGGNLFWVRREIALQQLPRLRALYDARKQPARLASQIGLGLLLRFFLAQAVSAGLLSVRAIEARVGRLVGAPVKAIFSPHASVGTDIDRLEHWLQVEESGSAFTLPRMNSGSDEDQAR